MTVKRAPAPKRIDDALLRRWPLPKVQAKLGKDGRGNVLVIGGSRQIPGAPMLAAIGALRAGAGRLQIAVAESVSGLVAVSVPEARVIGVREARSGELARGCHRLLANEVEQADAILVGPGMVDERAAVELMRHCARVRPQSSLVVDAAALRVFSFSRARTGRTLSRVVATPHAGEMAELWNCSRADVLANPLPVARAAAAKLGVVVALKGAHTFVVAPDGTAFQNVAGNPGLGTSGSGDILSGVIAGLCARGAPVLQAAVWGVYLHAKAGDSLARRVGSLGFLARELLGEIPPLLTKLGR
ncbi:MAG TPA: NAD(P)H-hydrate dehydratase [Polyangiaceae bacterium]|nr:NAD(P)H-hydrate dehydratase [Polyangiaceae bacterium]